MDINKIEKTIWDENILFYRILKSLIQSKIKSSILFDLQVLIERNKDKNLDSKTWYELISTILNYKSNSEVNTISELLLINSKNLNNFRKLSPHVLVWRKEMKLNEFNSIFQTETDCLKYS